MRGDDSAPPFLIEPGPGVRSTRPWTPHTNNSTRSEKQLNCWRARRPVIGGAEWSDLGFDDEEAATLKRLTGGDRAKLLAHLEATVQAFTELTRRLDLPRPGCRAALDGTSGQPGLLR